MYVMKNFLKKLIVPACVLLAAGCTKSDPAKDAATAFLEALKAGDYEKILESADSSLYKDFEETFDVDHLLEHYHDDDLRDSFISFRSSVISAQCTAYEITESTDEEDTVTYTAEITQLDTEEAEKNYSFDTFMSEHAAEAAEADALSEEEADSIRMKLVMDYGKAVLENAKSQELTKKITGTVTVHKENDTWKVTGFKTAE